MVIDEWEIQGQPDCEFVFTVHPIKTHPQSENNQVLYS